MMNLDGLPVPGGLRTYAQSADREKDVLQQSISVDPAWWSKRVPGAALTGDTAHPTLTRRDLFSLAEPARETADGARDLLWASLSWGTGTSQRNNARRIAALTDNPTLAEGLQRAVELAVRRSDVHWNLPLTGPHWSGRVGWVTEVVDIDP